VGEDVSDVGDRIPEHVPRDHPGEELALRERGEKRPDGRLEAVDFVLRERSIVESLPIDRADDRIDGVFLAHPIGEHPTGVAADRTALDREGEIPVSAGPDVAERGADDAPSDEIGAEAAMLLAQGLPEHDGRWVHGRHGGLGRDVDVLPPSAPLARRQGGERAESRVHAGPVRRLRKGGPNGSAARLPREPYRAVSGRCAREPPPTTTSSWPPCPS